MRAPWLDLSRPSLRYGLPFGLVVGMDWMAYNLISNLTVLDDYTWLNNGFLLAMLALYALAGWLAFCAAGRISAAIAAGITASLIGSAIGLATLWLNTFLFMDIIRQNRYMLEDFARSGAASMDDFIIEDALGASVFGPVLSLFFAIATTTVAGLAGWLVRRSGR
ncbi:MAG: hypothetical protein HY259_10320 [Chloroflexi bacterium]|nr:hypothetical protein [Chloroflexota bacterium]